MPKKITSFNLWVIVFSLILLMSLSLSSFAQQMIRVTGKVTGPDNTPLAGTSVQVKGQSSGTSTDEQGNFSISAIKGATLVFSNVGYNQREVKVNDVTLDVILDKADKSLNDVVVVGYGTQKKGSVTGSISSVKGEQLTVAPVASISNTLAGRLPGLVSVQSSGAPGADAALLSIRGFGQALVIVDGVESNFNNIDANQIESISILKDGAASIYGARAGNGVILVTTKRGQNQKPTITLNSSYTLQGVTKMLKPASAGQYTEMKREAWIQAGNPEATAPFTAEQVQKYYAGTDPLYPNTNWYEEIFREWAPQQQHNISVRGGSEKIRYYGFIGYTDQETIVKKGGGNYKRYNLQSNIDAKITDNLTLQLDLAAVSELSDFPIRGFQSGSSMWYDYFATKPYFPAHLSDPAKISWGGIDVGGINVTSNKDISGYTKNNNQNSRGTITLNYNIKAVKGLSVKAFANYVGSFNFNKNFSKPVSFYTEPAPGIYTPAGNYGIKASLTQGDARDRTFTQQYSLNYDNTLNNVHHITGIVLYEAIDYTYESLSASRVNFLSPTIDLIFAGSTVGMGNNGSANEMGRKSYIGRINYSFKNKYLFESTVRADASAKFPAGKRWGYFPNISLGWVASKEEFMQSLKKLDNLKLRASYGESGFDGVGNFQYLAGYNVGATYILGSDPQPGLVSLGIANPNLTWEKIKISNVGADFSLFNHKLYGEADIFYRELSGIPATLIATVPSTFGAGLPPVNINSSNDRGFEFNLGTTGKVGQISYDLSGNISWSRAKWGHYEEPEYKDSDQKRIYSNSGRWTDRRYGYLSDGLFTSQAQIDALTFDQDQQGNITLRPGDIRYKNINKDGKLDWKDQVEIGKSTIPHWMLGFNANIKFKDFDFSALFQGAFGYYANTNLNILNNYSFTSLYYDLRWTQANNNPNALVPRLGGASTNANPSDYYYKKAGYIRLKTASVGYNLPKRRLDKIGFSQVRIFAAGFNLLTPFNRLKKFGDPETPNTPGYFGLYYPQQRTISFGINVSF